MNFNCSSSYTKWFLHFYFARLSCIILFPKSYQIPDINIQIKQVITEDSNFIIELYKPLQLNDIERNSAINRSQKVCRRHFIGFAFIGFQDYFICFIFIACRSYMEHFLVNRFYVTFECTLSNLLLQHTRNISSSQLDEMNTTFSSAKKSFKVSHNKKHSQSSVYFLIANVN